MNTPSFFQRLFKSRFSPRGGGMFTGAGGAGYSPSLGNMFSILGMAPLPGSQEDYAKEVGPFWYNATVSIALGFIVTEHAEACLTVNRRTGDKLKPVPDHPLLQLLETPNESQCGDDLWSATLLSYWCDGNAYWRKVRDAVGRVRELYYVPHYQMRPIYPTAGNKFIDHWEYNVEGRVFELPTADVVHFKGLTNPEDYRLGLSPLRALVREIFTDNEASEYFAALLKNFGAPGAIISPKDTTQEILEPDREKLKELWRAQFTKSGRGSVLVAQKSLDIQKPCFSPEEMVLDKLRAIPEAKICAALLLSPMVLNLPAGEDYKTYSNYEEARSAAWETNLKPTQRKLANTLQRQLLPDFGANPNLFKVGWDYSDCSLEQEDQDKLAARAALLFEKGVITRAQALEMLGMEFDADDEVYANSPAGTSTDADPEPDAAAALEEPAEPYS